MLQPIQKSQSGREGAINNSSQPGDIVAGPFGGSGSTIIAREQTGRHARLIELEPKYVDAAVIRWQDFTRRAAVLEGDGRTLWEITEGALP